MTSFVIQCANCQRYKGGMSCEAFAKIPAPIFRSIVKHNRPVMGDKGLYFIPKAIPLQDPVIKGK